MGNNFGDIAIMAMSNMVYCKYNILFNWSCICIMEETLLQVIRNFVNRLLGILGMLSILVCIPLGIFLIATNKKKWTNKVVKTL